MFNKKVIALNDGKVNSSMKVVDLSSIERYMQTVSSAIENAIARVFPSMSGVTIQDVKAKNAAVLEIPGVDKAKLDFDPNMLYVFDPAKMDVKMAAEQILNGNVLFEHTAAGEATRLGLGTKYTLTPRSISAAMDDKRMTDLTDEQKQQVRDMTQGLMPISLGARKLLRLSLDIKQLAEANGFDANQALKNQTQLIILNEATADQIIADLVQHNFYGFDRNNIYFMVQKSMSGYTMKNGKVVQDPESESRLHNHGSLRQQMVMDQQIFTVSEGGDKQYMSLEKVKDVFRQKALMVSNNIEDLNHLEKGVLDLPAIALGLTSGQEGYGMVMTAVGQNQEKPIKGGYFGLNEETGEINCYESDSNPALASGKREELLKIKYLNKNVNMFPNPVQMLDNLATKDMPVHATVKDTKDEQGNVTHSAIYPQTPQGDLNFLLTTRYIVEKVVQSIRALKDQKNIPDTVRAMQTQDNDPEFRAWAEQYVRP